VSQSTHSQESTVHTDDGAVLSVTHCDGTKPVVLLHGLTATRRYVVMGSKALERSGHGVVAYDARGHGRSTPPSDPDSYDYGHLAGDLRRVMDELELERALLAGASMGAQTALRFALEDPHRVAGLAIVTPAYDPTGVDWQPGSRSLQRWDDLAHGLRTGGVEGFIDAYPLSEVPEQWRATVEKVLRQRMSAHEHQAAVADALQSVPRSRPFQSLESLTAIEVPTIVIASRDDADPGHPLAVGRSYAESIPGASLVVEPEGHSPIAWQGGALSRLISELSDRAHW
jgi:pimeloyl-ACP methyl ester carboxylesterase